MSRRGRGGTPISLFAFQDIITSVTGIMILITLILALELIQKTEGSPQNRTNELTAELQQATQQAATVQTTVAATQAEIENIRASLAGSETELLATLKVDSTKVSQQLQDLAELNKLLEAELAASTRQVQEAETASQSIEAEKDSKAQDHQTLESINETVQQKIEELKKLRQANRVIFNTSQSGPKTPWLVELGADKILAAEAGKKGPPQSFATPVAFVTWARKQNRASQYFVLLVKPATITQFETVRQALEKAGFEVGFDLLKADQTAIDPQTGAASP
jgi:myosin heavy subunit